MVVLSFFAILFQFYLLTHTPMGYIVKPRIVEIRLTERKENRYGRTKRMLLLP
ncbi:unknown [Clostridium sp. CAG:411]|nr:unknown [Clostridium sp. CAG:411]